MTNATLRPSHSAARVVTAAAAVLLVLTLSLLPASAQGAATYTKEKYQAFEEQLKSGQIREVTINKRLRTLRITLTDGRRFLAKYAPKEEPRVRNKLKAQNVAVHVLSTAAAQSTAERGKTKVHHKLRYIAGGIVIAVVVIVGGVVFYNRRRRARESV
jgi:ATP-dependent Zn protease